MGSRYHQTSYISRISQSEDLRSYYYSDCDLLKCAITLNSRLVNLAKRRRGIRLYRFSLMLADKILRQKALLDYSREAPKPFDSELNVIGDKWELSMWGCILGIEDSDWFNCHVAGSIVSSGLYTPLDDDWVMIGCEMFSQILFGVSSFLLSFRHLSQAP